jgi:hypothetical protein
MSGMLNKDSDKERIPTNSIRARYVALLASRDLNSFMIHFNKARVKQVNFAGSGSAPKFRVQLSDCCVGERAS